MGATRQIVGKTPRRSGTWQARVRAQAHPAWERVVVNDGNTNHTPPVLACLRPELGDDRLRVVATPCGGVCTARTRVSGRRADR